MHLDYKPTIEPKNIGYMSMKVDPSANHDSYVQKPTYFSSIYAQPLQVTSSIKPIIF